MHPIPALLVAALVPPQLQEEGTLLAAVPADAFALLHVVDPSALRSRAERNDWIAAYGSLEEAPALLALEQQFESATGTDFDGLFAVALELSGEALLFFTGRVAGFLTEPPADRASLASVLDGWLTDESRRSYEVAGGYVQLAPWPEIPGASVERTGHFLAFLDHPRALGLYSGDSADDVLGALTDGLGRLGSEYRAPVVDRFLAAGGGTTPGLAAFVDFTPFVPLAEDALRKAVEGVLPDPTGLLGLERGTWLFASADVLPGTRVELGAQLHLPEATLAARLADTFEPLPHTLPADLPRGTWASWALDWNLSGFYATARAGLERAEEGGLDVVDEKLAAAEALFDVDLLEDVIDQLAGWFAVYGVLDEGAPPAPSEQGIAFLAGLVDGYRFLDAFEVLIGAGGLGVEPIELEGAETYLWGPDDSGSEAGLSILPRRLVGSPSREILERSLRALGQVQGAGLSDGSRLQAAFDENTGAFAFAYAELSNLRTLGLLDRGPPQPDRSDPFESELILAGHRTAGGFEVRLYTR